MAAGELAHFKRDSEACVLLDRVRELQPELMEEWPELNDLWRKLRATRPA